MQKCSHKFNNNFSAKLLKSQTNKRKKLKIMRVIRKRKKRKKKVKWFFKGKKTKNRKSLVIIIKEKWNYSLKKKKIFNLNLLEQILLTAIIISISYNYFALLYLKLVVRNFSHHNVLVKGTKISYLCISC